jgi:hypothetical protein
VGEVGVYLERQADSASWGESWARAQGRGLEGEAEVLFGCWRRRPGRDGWPGPAHLLCSSGLAGHPPAGEGERRGRGHRRAHQVGAWGRDDGGQPAEEGGGGEDELGGAGGRGALHPVAELAVREDGEALQGEWVTGAEPLQALAVVLMHPGVGVQGEALQEGAAPGTGVRAPRPATAGGEVYAWPRPGGSRARPHLAVPPPASPSAGGTQK